MKDYEEALKSCGIPAMTTIILCYHLDDDILEAVIDAMRDGDDDVGAVQSEPEACAR